MLAEEVPMAFTRRIVSLVASIALFSGIAYGQRQPIPTGATQVAPASLVWRDGPPTLPKGAKVAALEGDSRKEGMFTIRIKIPAGSSLAPHTHPADERVTVMSGAVQIGFGRLADRSRTNRLRAGSFYINPAGKEHFLFFPEETIVQITGMGPWKLDFVK
jgi:quercetin dioxygenase-like cupin family protein